MRPSHFFSDLLKSYLDELDDLETDSDGKRVLQRRLDEKRRELGALLPMVGFSPEMVAVIYHGAFEFLSAEVMQQIVESEPGRDDFPLWDDVAAELVISDWARPLVDATRRASGGDDFLVVTAALEFCRSRAAALAPVQAQPSGSEADAGREAGERDDDYDADAAELNEAGDDWLAEQGFDTLDRSA